jgi:hypothetical protein
VPVVVTVRTATRYAWWALSLPRRYATAAGCPLARVGTIRQSPGEKRGVAGKKGHAGLEAGEPGPGPGHLEHRVLPEYVLQGCRIGILEGGDVPVEECMGYRFGGLGDFVSRRCQQVEPGAGALERALDGCRGGPEHLRDLGGWKGEPLAQQQHRSLPRRKVLQTGRRPG